MWAFDIAFDRFSRCRSAACRHSTPYPVDKPDRASWSPPSDQAPTLASPFKWMGPIWVIATFLGASPDFRRKSSASRLSDLSKTGNEHFAVSCAACWGYTRPCPSGWAEPPDRLPSCIRTLDDPVSSGASSDQGHSSSLVQLYRSFVRLSWLYHRWYPFCVEPCYSLRSCNSPAWLR